MPIDPHSPKVAHRKGFINPATSVLALVLVLFSWHAYTLATEKKQAAPAKPVSLASAPKPAKLYPVTISVPTGPPVAWVPDPKDSGKLVAVSCTTCHATREPDTKNVTAADMDEFHEDLNMAHGQLSCLSCHNPSDYDALKKADGSSVTYPNVMQLCAQCHQGRYNDYQHGAHGGMNGYWDLSKGPRTRKSCIVCHDPHAPAIAKMLPQFKPLDRFMDTPEPKAHQTQASH